MNLSLLAGSLRWIALVLSAVVYFLSVNLIEYDSIEGITFLKDGSAWFFAALLSCLLGGVAGMIIGRTDFLKKKGATVKAKIIGAVIFACCFLLAGLAITILFISLFFFPVILPGATVSP